MRNAKKRRRRRRKLIYNARKQICECQETWGQGKRELTKGRRELSGVMGTFTVFPVWRFCSIRHTRYQSHQTVHFKYVPFIVYQQEPSNTVKISQHTMNKHGTVGKKKKKKKDGVVRTLNVSESWEGQSEEYLSDWKVLRYLGASARSGDGNPAPGTGSPVGYPSAAAPWALPPRNPAPSSGSSTCQCIHLIRTFLLQGIEITL